MNQKKIVTTILMAIISCLTLNAQELFTISGSIAYKGEEPVYVYLVDEEIAKIPFTGIQTLVLTPAESGGTLPFSFISITAGTYGIRCFQDTNKNGELDRGMFGPKEPWGMSWQGEKPRKWPRWDDFSFELITNIGGIDIILSE